MVGVLCKMHGAPIFIFIQTKSALYIIVALVSEDYNRNEKFDCVNIPVLKLHETGKLGTMIPEAGNHHKPA